MSKVSSLNEKGRKGAAGPSQFVTLRLGTAARRASELGRFCGLALPVFLLAGCTAGGAPAIPFIGAFFPSWLLSAFAGIAVAILARVVFVLIGIDDALPARLLVYVGIATCVGFLVSDIVFGR